MLSAKHLEDAVAALRTMPIARNSVQRRIALGVTGVSDTGQQGWIVLKYDGDSVQSSELHVTQPMDDVDASLDVEVAVLASPEVWIRIGAAGHEGAVLAADRRDLDVSGKLPYFIRNVRSLLDIAVQFASELTKVGAAANAAIKT